MTIAGVILAGGQSRRMGGGEKALLEVNGVSLLSRTIARARPQVGPLVLNTNSTALQTAAPNLPAVTDPIPGFAGPLVGLLAGLDWVRAHAPGIDWLASFPVDAPLFPMDLVSRLATAVTMETAEVACATSGGRRHPVFGLWPTACANDLRRALEDEGLRRVNTWIARFRVAVVAWPLEPHDPFHNVNAPDDLANLQAMLTDAPEHGSSRRDQIGDEGRTLSLFDVRAEHVIRSSLDVDPSRPPSDGGRLHPQACLRAHKRTDPPSRPDTADVSLVMQSGIT